MPSTRFYGTVSVNPVNAKNAFSMLIDEVVQNFTQEMGVDVTISIEINAHAKNGFSDTLQRTIRENCSSLKFNSAEFEGD